MGNFPTSHVSAPEARWFTHKTKHGGFPVRKVLPAIMGKIIMKFKGSKPWGYHLRWLFWFFHHGSGYGKAATEHYSNQMNKSVELMRHSLLAGNSGWSKQWHRQDSHRTWGNAKTWQTPVPVVDERNPPVDRWFIDGLSHYSFYGFSMFQHVSTCFNHPR